MISQELYDKAHEFILNQLSKEGISPEMAAAIAELIKAIKG